jgi:hypothetical protein
MLGAIVIVRHSWPEAGKPNHPAGISFVELGPGIELHDIKVVSDWSSRNEHLELTVKGLELEPMFRYLCTTKWLELGFIFAGHVCTEA